MLCRYLIELNESARNECSVCVHRAVGLDVGSLQSDCDAVEEDEEQHNMIKHLMSDDFLTAHPEPAENERERVVYGMRMCKHSIH